MELILKNENLETIDRLFLVDYVSYNTSLKQLYVSYLNNTSEWLNYEEDFYHFSLREE